MPRDAAAATPQDFRRSIEESAPMDLAKGILTSSPKEASSISETTLFVLQVTPEAGAATPEPMIPTSKGMASTGEATSVAIEAQKTPNLGDGGPVRKSMLPAPTQQNSITNRSNSVSFTIPRVISNTGNKPKLVVSDNASRFGDRDDYWTNYDKLTKKYDEDSTGRLNSNLENVLIFVSVWMNCCRGWCS
ncbi:hypothetical protein FRB94_001216 [Tulasnella sp. JGI-2019a]|nr:hypothetical protein FRB94_001216 [Tulasnella sp. JGI-2019a]